MWQEEHVGTPSIEDLAGVLVQCQDGVLGNRLLHVTIINVVTKIVKWYVLTKLSLLVCSLIRVITKSKAPSIEYQLLNLIPLTL